MNLPKDFIEIIPPGEEDLHISGIGCSCWPVVTMEETTVLTHNPIGRRINTEASVPVDDNVRRAA